MKKQQHAFRVSDKAKLKPVTLTSETSKKTENLHVAGSDMNN